jgi:hypothetical protein
VQWETVTASGGEKFDMPGGCSATGNKGCNVDKTISAWK